MKKLKISRKKWLRATQKKECMGVLLDEKGKQCCVGIYLSGLGVSDKALLEKSTASEVKKLPAAARWLKAKEDGVLGDSPAAGHLYLINDKLGLKPKDREKKIQEAFAEQDIQVEFTQ